MDEFFNPGGDSAQDYERLLGHRVIIYYRDQRGTDRKLIGRIVEIDGDKMWLENTHKRTSARASSGAAASTAPTAR